MKNLSLLVLFSFLALMFSCGGGESTKETANLEINNLISSQCLLYTNSKLMSGPETVTVLGKSYPCPQPTRPDPTYVTIDIGLLYDGSIRKMAMIPEPWVEDYSSFLFAGSCVHCSTSQYLMESRSFLKFNIGAAGVNFSKIVSAKLRMSVLEAIDVNSNFPAIRLSGINDFGILDIDPFDGDDDWNLDNPANGGEFITEVTGLRTGVIEFNIPIADLKSDNNFFMIKSDTLEKFYFFASSRNPSVDLRPYLRLKVQQ